MSVEVGYVVKPLVGKPTLYGVGVNDADYQVQKYRTVDGKCKRYWLCPYYNLWVHMLARCYSEYELKKCPTYRGATVCDEWLLFSNFKAWVKTQKWEDENGNRLHLDKDFLSGSKRGKEYNPQVCLFITGALNKFLTDTAAKRGDTPVGVSYHKSTGKYQALVCNPFTGKNEYLGIHVTPEIAHAAYVKRKKELAAIYAEQQTDPRIAEALLNMDWS